VFTLPEGKLVSYFGIIPKGHVLDVPNAVLGSLFYLQQLVMGGMPDLVLNPVMVSFAFCTSIFLAYQLTFVLGDLCLLCWSTHVINATLFYKIVVPILTGSDKKSSAFKGKAE
jgi:uncharacterized membrane protein